MIHIGRRTTLTTFCGKSVRRRWWVEAAHIPVGAVGALGADCKRCLAAQRMNPGVLPAREMTVRRG